MPPLERYKYVDGNIEYVIIKELPRVQQFLLADFLFGQAVPVDIKDDNGEIVECCYWNDYKIFMSQYKGII